MPRDVRDIVGRGFAFPLNIDNGGSVKWSVPLTGATDDDRVSAINGRVKHVVLTILGQRVLLREFGSEMTGGLFMMVQPAYVSTILSLMVAAIERWEPRVAVRDAEVTVESGIGQVYYSLSWNLSSSSLDGALTIPMGFEFRETV